MDLERLDEAINEAVGFYDGVEEAMPEAFRVLVAVGRELANGEREWHCEYPEFDDPHCQSGMGNPQPDKTRQPRKHTQCRWILLVDYPTEEE